MAVVTMKQLLEAGVHFGHQTRRWNPKMKRFIFTERNGIYIIDLQQTLTYIDEAYEFVKETVAHGGTMLFVGTKKQAQEAIAEQATRVGMPYVNERWLGGMLTNFQTVFKRLAAAQGARGDGRRTAASAPTKKEALMLTARRTSSSETLGGIRDMQPHPERGVDRRHQEGAHRRRRGPQAGHPGRRDPRHQLRPRRGRLQDPGQRRRHPLSAGLLTRVIADAVAEGLMARAAAAANAGRDEKAARGPGRRDEPLRRLGARPAPARRHR